MLYNWIQKQKLLNIKGTNSFENADMGTNFNEKNMAQEQTKIQRNRMNQH